jgi:hypothetical protein
VAHARRTGLTFLKLDFSSLLASHWVIAKNIANEVPNCHAKSSAQPNPLTEIRTASNYKDLTGTKFHTDFCFLMLILSLLSLISRHMAK